MHDGTDVWQFLDFEIPNVGLNAVAGRPPEEYGIDPTSFDELRPGCYDVHAARARHVGERRARLAQLPVAARLRGPPVRRARRQGRRARARARRTTTGTSTSGAAPRPTASSRSRSRRSGIPRRSPTRCAASRRRAATRSRSPRTRCRSGCRACTPTTGTRSGRRAATRARSSACTSVRRRKLVDHRARRADRRDDHAAADEHRAGRGRPHLLAGVQEVPRRHGRAVRGRDRLDPLLPRAPRPHVQARTRRGRSPTSATSCRARCSWST